MWKSFKFYLALLCMCIACIVPAAMLTLPDEQMGLPGAFVVFGAGGGLVYACFSLYFETYTDKWKNNHGLISKIISLVSGIIGLGLLILIQCLYGSSTFGFINLLVEFKGDVLELMLRVLCMVASGLSIFSIYTVMIGEVDTEEYVYLRTTYSNGEPIKQEYVTHSPNDSKAIAFFMTILAACIGIMANSFALLAFILFFNIGSFLRGKGKIITLILGILAALTIVGISVADSFAKGDEYLFGLIINVTLNYLPVVYALLMFLYFLGFFNIEWLSNPIGLLIGCFVSIFVAYFASFGLSYLTQFCVGFFSNI